MNRCRLSVIGIAVLSIVVFFGHTQAGEKGNSGKGIANRAVPVNRVIAALRGGCPHIKVIDKERTEDWTWIEVAFPDETYPLTIDVMIKKTQKSDKIIYLLTSSSLNFKSSFFTPADSSMAKYLAGRGYLIVGITPREDNVPLEADQSVMAAWGLEKHREDIRTIVQLIQGAIGKPYDMLGHSLGAICALDYAATYSDDLDTVMVLDLPSFDPVQQPEKIFYAELAYDAYEQLINNGTYSDYSVTQLKSLLMAAALFPDFDSGQDRGFVGLPGNFTYNGLLHFSLIYTAYLPGTITELTGLPQEWPMIQGYAAGHYSFDFDPLQDDFDLSVTSVDTILLTSAQIGSGAAPLALTRDYTAAIANLAQYEIDWNGIEEKVIWVNSELGMGSQTYGAELIRSGGNEDITVTVVPGYGHIDVIFGNNASDDIWPLFTNE